MFKNFFKLRERVLISDRKTYKSITLTANIIIQYCNSGRLITNVNKSGTSIKKYLKTYGCWCKVYELKKKGSSRNFDYNNLLGYTQK